MLGLFMPIFSIVSTTLMGVGVIVALVSGNDGLRQILIAVAAGFVVALPVAWGITKKLL